MLISETRNMIARVRCLDCCRLVVSRTLIVIRMLGVLGHWGLIRLWVTVR